MSLENLHCPQFVDFTVQETFDINDGADFFFEKGVVGELDLGMGFGQAPPPDPIEQLTEKMTNLTNLTPVQQQGTNLKEQRAASVKKAKEDKENQPKKQSKPVGKSVDIAPNSLDSVVSSAIELVICASTTNKKETKTPNTPPPPPGFHTESSKDLSTCASKSTTPTLSEFVATPPIIQTTTPVTEVSVNKNNNDKLNCKKQPVIANANSNIVKKTLAKMTAAFKQTKPSPTNEILKNKRTIFQSSHGTKTIQKVVSQEKTTTTTTATISRFELKPMSPEASSGRRCSSVPRTLREKQALNRGGIVVPSIEDIDLPKSNKVPKQSNHNSIGEKIHNFFNTHNSSNQKSKQQSYQKQETPTSLGSAPVKTLVKASREASTEAERRRSRSAHRVVNHADPAAKIVHQLRRSIDSDTLNAVKAKPVVAKAMASPSLSKQKSDERAQPLPLYQGVKFIPKLAHKYGENVLPAFSMQQSSHSTTLTSSLTPLPLDEILKNRPICMQKNKPVVAMAAANFSKKQQQPVMVNRTTPGKSASFRVSSNNTSVTSSKPTKPSASEHNLNTSENNICDLKQAKSNAFNTSTTGATNTSRIRKKSESNCSISAANTSSTANPGYLHTELRAFKRQEYDQAVKEKEKMASLLKQELESDKLKKQQEEIQKIRMQRNFRSNPVKHYKPVELKPSVRPLTDPKSPQLSNSMLKLNSSAMGRHNDSMNNQSSSHRLSMALVDAPIIRKYNGGNMSKNDSQLQAKPRLTSKQRTVSQDDVRY